MRPMLAPGRQGAFSPWHFRATARDREVDREVKRFRGRKLSTPASFEVKPISVARLYPDGEVDENSTINLTGRTVSLTWEVKNVDPQLIRILLGLPQCQLEHEHHPSTCIYSNIVLGEN